MGTGKADNGRGELNMKAKSVQVDGQKFAVKRDVRSTLMVGRVRRKRKGAGRGGREGDEAEVEVCLLT
jgi:hypothetical protein